MKRRRAAIKRSRGRGFLGIDGAAAVEFAITAPMLVVLVLGIADYGLLVADSSALEGATRAGAEVGKANPSSVTAAQLAAFFPSGIMPTVTSVCTCVDNTWPTGTACPPGPLAATPSCAGKTNPFIAGNPVDQRVFEYVQVSATQAVIPIVSYGTYTSGKSVNGNTIIRFQ
jgi:Flp pilus assembly protein TadG